MTWKLRLSSANSFVRMVEDVSRCASSCARKFTLCTIWKPKTSSRGHQAEEPAVTRLLALEAVPTTAHNHRHPSRFPRIETRQARRRGRHERLPLRTRVPICEAACATPALRRLDSISLSLSAIAEDLGPPL
ncbi:hypothetical protein PsYK624_104170 [Phanerochaete sordida]|uniref:Uncharacterized protein n=1 Tax=Phanerochaete sordida TaxID=48140 RepID=A0A9P3GDT6_9APHY|nr:hypothetical protein PsYK624_104170 [Phanerochaete sordida]